ncbi:SDR family oxidoreductase [Dyadobacter sediminis]|uniref:SDR family oxidoreductase n=1 Tax=Dyadobacter sediminis TaxID=1493691 RepID=A0A5R9K8J0_9BACT|nr:SDR family oxidoreductase [Dyadobacter sediminis]TLU90320.1 SDR family oxidoreductase [Dyadobacter sediminis]GGC06837.1 NAD(P)-dependent oxidoreductase [Dyadobacter sediminis]
MILVTGATGGLGHQTIESLLTTVPAAEIAVLVRDVSKATDLVSQGVDVRQADYLDYPSLVQAFRGIEKVLLVSAVAFTDRVHQHQNVIDAAREAGVKHLFYTSIQRSTDFVMQEVTESDLTTEAYLKESGLVYTILKNGFYFEGLGYLIGSEVPNAEILFPAGEGRIAFVKRAELAAVTAALLTSEGHDNQEYTLSGSEAYSFHDIAKEFTALAGRPIVYKNSELAPYIEQKVATGFPEIVANFLGQWGAAAEHGMLAGTHDTVERLLGRRPTSLREYLKATYFPGI